MTRISAPRAITGVVRNDPSTFALCVLQWTGFHASPLAVGYVLKLVLDRLGSSDPSVPWLLLGAIAGLEVGRWALLVSAAVQWHGAWVGWLSVPRVNMLTSLATRPGADAHRLPGSPGEAVSRFRDDAQDVGQVLDVWLDVTGSLVAAGIAIVVMASIDPYAAAATMVPVGVALAVSVVLGPTLRRWRRDAREATGVVTSFIGDTFGSILAVKTAAAEDAVDRHFATLNAKRALLARRDQIGSELIRSLGYGTAEVTIGVVLLIVATGFRNGELSVGDIGLFAAYVPVVAGLPKWVGRMGALHRQADVSVDRLAELMHDRQRTSALQPVITHLRHGPPPFEHHSSLGEPLRRFVVDSLTAQYDQAGHGVADISFDVGAGELVAVTGAVGAGKSTLLRAVLGLSPIDSGHLWWNESPIDDPSSFMVPPRVAYLPQVPRLFSESLAETILLGRPDHDLAQALWLACLDADLSHMEAGADTIIGPRGLRLSGGQIQRTGAARALVRRPELLVIDDLSSALDVETEAELWARLRGPAGKQAGSAILIVSHRPQVLAMADRVITLDSGRLGA